MIDALYAVDGVFQPGPPESDGIEALLGQSAVIVQMQSAIETMTIEVARNMYAAGWSLRAIGEALETNHAGVASWLEQTGDRPRE
ncbi:terminase gpP N-terminus-related DNA-binding protein [Yaniella flava]